jgi:hypothetical protein
MKGETYMNRKRSFIVLLLLAVVLVGAFATAVGDIKTATLNATIG